MQWNDAQTRAIQVTDGPAMILAGPGSGKTTVIVHRVKSLIDVHGVSPENILVLTFTRAAAAEMRDRAARLSCPDGVTWGTFHAVFYHILKREWNVDGDRVLSPEKKKDLLRRITALIPRTLPEAGLEKLSEELDRLRLKAASGRPFVPEVLPEAELSFVRDVYVGYLRRYGLFDYDEMIARTEDLLLHDADRRRFWRGRYRYVLVDEFQDIDRRQYDLVRLLAQPADNLFVVGDDDQSIYGFRGAGTGMMQAFARDYPRAKRITLAVNYRSTPQIVAAAALLIRHNRDRFDKRLRTENPDGDRVRIRLYEDAAAEHIALAGEARRLIADGVPPEEIAVLVRIHTQKRAVAAALKRAGVPVAFAEAEDGAARRDAAGEQNGAGAAGPGVRLLTMHAAKGLEFDAVFLPNVCEGLVPYRRAKTAAEVEEERRLFYVAMTRARCRLTISCPKKMRGRQALVSRFITEMTE